jgi:DNA-3-methyladenine glycosylase II
MMIQETFMLDPIPPFRLDLTAWTLRRRASNRIDQWDGTTYTRVLLLDRQPVKVTVSQQDRHLLVTAASPVSLPQLTARVSSILQRTLGLATDVSAFSALARRNQEISALAERFQGLKPPRFPTLFEAFLNAFACQQVSLDVGILLLDRLAERYGLPWTDEQGAAFAFPDPEQLLSTTEEQFRELGWSRQKGRAVLELARLLTEAPHTLAALPSMSNEDACHAILPLRGVGRWTAEYVLLRGLGRIEVFPGDDVGAQKNLQRLLSLEQPPTYERVKTLTASWSPFAGFVYFHLLLRNLDKKGLLPPY